MIFTDKPENAGSLRGRNVKSIPRQSMKDKLIKKCLDRAKSERMRLLSIARSQQSAPDVLNGQDLAALIRTAITDEIHSRDTPMSHPDALDVQRHIRVENDEELEHLSSEEYLDLMRSLEEEILCELRGQGPDFPYEFKVNSMCIACI